MSKENKLQMSDEKFSFSDMKGFMTWVLKADSWDNATRYIYIESKDYFIDDNDNGNRYSWEELYKIYQGNCT